MDEYFDLILLVLLGLGLVFELPILIFFLTLFGIVTPQFLIKNFRYALLVITVLAAVLTPSPDALSMVLFMLVLVALYFVGVGVSWAVVRKKKKREAAEAR
jgi:sec-independent protein translocase protein TatC